MALARCQMFGFNTWVLQFVRFDFSVATEIRCTGAFSIGASETVVPLRIRLHIIVNISGFKAYLLYADDDDAVNARDATQQAATAAKEGPFQFCCAPTISSSCSSWSLALPWTFCCYFLYYYYFIVSFLFCMSCLQESLVLFFVLFIFYCAHGISDWTFSISYCFQDHFLR